MEQKVCKNKKCQRLLPATYKHKYCENCRNKRAGQVKKVVPAASAATAFGVATVRVIVKFVTKGNVNLK